VWFSSQDCCDLHQQTQSFRPRVAILIGLLPLSMIALIEAVFEQRYRIAKPGTSLADAADRLNMSQSIAV
jgi:hypothetical protein